MFAAQCEVQEKFVRVFDNLEYQHDIKGGGCPYVLVQDHRRGKECRFKVRLLPRLFVPTWIGSVPRNFVLILLAYRLHPEPYY